MGRIAHDIVVRLGELAAAAIFVTGFLLWRLTQGPIELDRLAPWVQQALDRPGSGVHIALTGVRFGIDRHLRQLDLWLENVRLSRDDGEPLATFPEMETSFSPGSLLRGTLAPTHIVVDRPVLRLVRDPGGAFKFGFGAQDAGAPEFGPEIFDQLTGPPRQDTQFGALNRIMIRDATVILDDRRTGRRWQASRVDASLDRDAGGLAGDLSLALAVGTAKPQVQAHYQYSGNHQLDLNLAVDGIEPATLSTLSPELAPLDAAHFPITGTLQTRLDLARGTLAGVRLDLGFGQGSIRAEQLPDGTLPLIDGELHAVYAPETGEVRLDKLAFNLGGGSTLTLDGTLQGLTPELIANPTPSGLPLPGKLDVTLSNVPVAKFETLWPPALSRGGRRWVLANIHDGVLDQAAVQLDLRADVASRSGDVVSARGSLHFHDLTINYFKTLPPLRKVSGTGTLADKKLEFTPTGGGVKGVQLTGGSVEISNLGSRVELLAIDLTLAGPIQDVLAIIDAKPLQYAHDVGIDPATVGGRADLALHFKLPLLDDVKFEAVDYAAKATLTGTSVMRAVLGRDLTQGNLALNLTHTGLTVQGSARLDNVPATLGGELFFKPKDGPRARYRVALTLDDAERRRLKFDFLPDRVNGPIAADVTYTTQPTGPGGDRAQAAVQLDLKAADLSVAEVGWHKKPGEPGSAKLWVDLDDDRVAKLTQIDIRAAGLFAQGALTLDPATGAVESADVQRLAIGGTDVAGTVRRRGEGGWRIDFHGPRLDLAQVIANARRSIGNASDEGRHPPLDPPGPPIMVEARLGQLTIGRRREVRALSASLYRDDGHWISARIDARFPSGRGLALRFGVDREPQHLTFSSDDLGATLNLLNVADNVTGGQVAVTGEVSGTGAARAFRGRVDGANYHLMNAPVVAQMLSLTSLTGIASLLSGNGIPFTTLSGNFSYADERIVVDRMLAYGGPIGLTANGVFDLDRDNIDMQGTLVPAYTLNSILGRVPLIGSLLVGGEGQGLFGATYRVTGSGADPHISVNPLTALAPGFLRRLFQPNFGLPPTDAAPTPMR